MAYQGRFQNGPAKSSGLWWKILLIVILSLVVIIGGLVLAVLKLGPSWLDGFLTSKLSHVQQAEFVERDVSGQDLSHLLGNMDETEPTTMPNQAETEPTTEPTTEPATEATEPDYGQTGKIINIILVGQDSREGEESKLADTIILMTMNKETHTLTMTSFLRDSYVKLANYGTHTCGWNRINTSYALGYAWYGDGGAMGMLNQTLQENFGVQVDGNVEISLPGLWDLLDYLGTVDIELDNDEYNYMLGIQEYYNAHYTEVNEPDRITDIQPGLNALNADLALSYARMRHATPGDSDMNRSNRQRKLVTAVLEKMLKMSPMELDEFTSLALSKIISNISTEDMKTYILELTPYLIGLNLETYQIPAPGTYWGDMVELPDGVGGVLKIDFPKNKQVVAAIQNGEPVPTFQ